MRCASPCLHLCIGGSREGPGGHVPPLDNLTVPLLHVFHRWIQGRGGTCPLDHIGLCCVGSKSYFADVHTAKVIIQFISAGFYDSTVCISLYFGIFSYRLVFGPTYFTFWRSHIFTFHSLRTPPQTVILLNVFLLHYLGILLLHWS